jgi:hypothetical protein
MNLLNDGMTRLFDVLLAPVAAWPAVAMAVVSALTAVWALLLFKAVTPQARLDRVRDRLFGHIYEMGLYPNHLRVVARIQRDLARANLRYLSLTLPALAVLAVPMVLTLAQMDSRFSHRPLRPGEEAVFAVTLAGGQAMVPAALELVVPTGLQVVAGPVHDRSAGAVAWRLTALTNGAHRVSVRDGERELVGRVVPVGGGLSALGETSRRAWLPRLLSPGAPSLAANSAVTEMSLQLPGRTTYYFGLALDWLPAFMACSLLFGLAVKDLLRVSI